MANRFKDTSLRDAYDEAVAAYEAKHKNLFLPSGQRRGLHDYSHGSKFSISFWSGFDGKDVGPAWDRYSRQTPAYAIWCAGRDMARKQETPVN